MVVSPHSPLRPSLQTLPSVLVHVSFPSISSAFLSLLFSRPMPRSPRVLPITPLNPATSHFIIVMVMTSPQICPLCSPLLSLLPCVLRPYPRLTSLSHPLPSCFLFPKSLTRASQTPFPLAPNHFPFLPSPDPSCFALEIRSSNAILCGQPCSSVFKQRTSLLPFALQSSPSFYCILPTYSPSPSLPHPHPLHSEVCSPLCVFFGVLNACLFFNPFPRLTLPLRLTLSSAPPYYIFYKCMLPFVIAHSPVASF